MDKKLIWCVVGQAALVLFQWFTIRKLRAAVDVLEQGASARRAKVAKR
jgi:hypothetical protein